MTCPKCGTYNFAIEEYCDNCGEHLIHCECEENEQNENQRRPVFSCIIAGLVIAVASVFLVFFSTSAAPSNSEVIKSTSTSTETTTQEVHTITFTESDTINLNALVNVYNNNGETIGLKNVRLEIPSCEDFDGYDFSKENITGENHTYCESDGYITINLNYTLDDNSTLNISLVYNESNFTTQSLVYSRVQANTTIDGQALCCDTYFNNNGDVVSYNNHI